MKKLSVIVLTVFSLALASYAEAAKPRKRSRNANRVGAYGAALAGFSTFKGDHAQNEIDLVQLLNNQGIPAQNVVGSTDDTDIGYQAAFGYRFNRYLAAELGLAQYGELTTTASGEVDVGQGFVPAALDLTFSVGGPVISMIGILPVSEKFEFYARAGVLFASAERELSSRLDGQSGGFGSAKGDSTEAVLGVGFSWNINQIYSIRAEYQKVGEVGQQERTGTEELDVIALGLVVRF